MNCCIEYLLDYFMTKLTALKSELDGVKANVDKLVAENASLKQQLADVSLPADAETSLTALKAAAAPVSAPTS